MPAIAAKTVLITAGEASGDRLGAALMRGLKAHGKYVFHGVGGPLMKKEGLKEIFPMEEIAVMGLVEVIPAIPRVMRRIKDVEAWARANLPDVAITIDAQDFSNRVRARLRRFLPMLPLVQVNSPTVWAWREGRVKALARDTDLVLCLFPFEVGFLTARGVKNAVYMGHPAVATLEGWGAGMGLRGRAFEVALLPGSRRGEIARHWPVLLASYRRLKKLLPQLKAVLVLGEARLELACREAADWDKNEVDVMVGEDRFARLAACRLALAKSGTNNLELALLGVPAVVGYRMNKVSYWLARMLVRTRWISLPNIIMNSVIYPEFIQDGFKEENVARAAYGLLSDDKIWSKRVKQLGELKDAMAVKGESGEIAAAAIRKLIQA